MIFYVCADPLIWFRDMGFKWKVCESHTSCGERISHICDILYQKYRLRNHVVRADLNTFSIRDRIGELRAKKVERNKYNGIEEAQ